MSSIMYDPQGSGKGIPIHYHSRPVGAYLYILLTGKLTYGYESRAKEGLRRAVRPAEGYMIDLSGLALIDSTGLGVLVHFVQTYCKDCRGVAVIVQDELMKELLAIAKLELLMPICESVQEAVQRLDEIGKVLEEGREE
ncbi:hypothetical protein GCM10023310_14580 [Paenibacillus vulneris]|uniref:STAS domain-containing protein n=1 Tax=Paenibacillus vulneris TaxID=1133364 RepID=A0ABW3ULM4_9BACL|nr:STAS domain-containing protein [Paenibacillus sp. 32352]